MGVVETVLPRAMYLVRTKDGRGIRAGLDAICRGTVVKLIAGDRVRVRVAERDPGRGKIVEKISDKL